VEFFNLILELKLTDEETSNLIAFTAALIQEGDPWRGAIGSVSCQECLCPENFRAGTSHHM